MVRVRALFSNNVIKKKWPIQWSYLLSKQHLPKMLMWARSSMGHGLSTKHVACPRYGCFGRSSG